MRLHSLLLLCSACVQDIVVSRVTDHSMQCCINTCLLLSTAAFLKTADEGAAVSVNCAANPALNSQTALYYDGSHGVKQSSPLSR